MDSLYKVDNFSKQFISLKCIWGYRSKDVWVQKQSIFQIFTWETNHAATYIHITNMLSIVLMYQRKYQENPLRFFVVMWQNIEQFNVVWIFFKGLYTTQKSQTKHVSREDLRKIATQKEILQLCYGSLLGHTWNQRQMSALRWTKPHQLSLPLFAPVSPIISPRRTNQKPTLSKHTGSAQIPWMSSCTDKKSASLCFHDWGNPRLVLTQSYQASLGEVLFWLNMPEALLHHETNPPVCQTTGGSSKTHMLCYVMRLPYDYMLP